MAPVAGVGPPPERASVVRVVDGDTLDVRLQGGSTARVRLLGIDTPEVYRGTECGGPAASRAAERLLPEGTVVLLVADPTQDRVDRYGRILRYVMRGSVDIDRLLVLQGHATVYVYERRPFQRVRAYVAAELSARKNDRGIWGQCR